MPLSELSRSRLGAHLLRELGKRPVDRWSDPVLERIRPSARGGPEDSEQHPTRRPLLPGQWFTTSADPSSNGITFTLPDTTASVWAPAAVLAPDSTLELVSLDLDWQP